MYVFQLVLRFRSGAGSMSLSNRICFTVFLAIS